MHVDDCSEWVPLSVHPPRWSRVQEQASSSRVVAKVTRTDNNSEVCRPRHFGAAVSQIRYTYYRSWDV